MYILRIKDNNGIQTLPFGTEEGVRKAADWVMQTTAAGFIAEADGVDATKGKILKKWDHCTRYGRRELSYTIKYGAYKDHVWAVLGTEENCLAMASQQNEKSQGWWCTHAHVEHLIGPLWQCVFTDPYLD